jgi:hypothetical protein
MMVWPNRISVGLNVLPAAHVMRQDLLRQSPRSPIETSMLHWIRSLSRHYRILICFGYPLTGVGSNPRFTLLVEIPFETIRPVETVL